MMLKRDAVNAVGGFEEHFNGPRQMYEDQAFLAKLYLAYPVYFSDHVWLKYRRHDTSFVDSVKRAGGYQDVRMYFLTWFERYMCERPNSHPKVLRVVRSSIWLARHPLANRLRSAIGRLLRGVRRHASSLARSASSIRTRHRVDERRRHK